MTDGCFFQRTLIQEESILTKTSCTAIYSCYLNFHDVTLNFHDTFVLMEKKKWEKRKTYHKKNGFLKASGSTFIFIKNDYL